MTTLSIEAPGHGSCAVPWGGRRGGEGALPHSPCFLKGTLISTFLGPVPVENLARGTQVLTAHHGSQEVRWLGYRALIAQMVNEHHRRVWLPVRIVPDALGVGIPNRTLYLSPGHMLYVEGGLVPVSNLLNGRSIAIAEEFEVLEYYNVLFDRHEMIFAQGVPVESLSPGGDMSEFTNIGSYPQTTSREGDRTDGHDLPILTDESRLEALHRRFVQRAGELGFAVTRDDDLRLLVDGIVVGPSARLGATVSFEVPEAAREVRIVSRSVIPAEIDPATHDHRRLGVCIKRIALRNAFCSVEMDVDYRGLDRGFHPPEEDHRWTNGDAAIPGDVVATMVGTFSLEIALVQADLSYPVR
jgi:hypothetical protein